MKNILIMYFVLLTGCSINSSSNISSNETNLSNNILNTSSNNTSETIANFAYITGIKLEDVKYVGYSRGTSINNATDNKEIIEKIYKSINKEFLLSDYTYEDINDPILSSYMLFIYYSRMDYYQLMVYDDYLYFKTSIDDTFYFKSSTKWSFPL